MIRVDIDSSKVKEISLSDGLDTISQNLFLEQLKKVETKALQKYAMKYLLILFLIIITLNSNAQSIDRLKEFNASTTRVFGNNNSKNWSL